MVDGPQLQAPVYAAARGTLVRVLRWSWPGGARVPAETRADVVGVVLLGCLAAWPTFLAVVNGGRLAAVAPCLIVPDRPIGRPVPG